MKEGWMKNDDDCWGVLLMDRKTNKQTDICDCRVAFATENNNMLLVLQNSAILSKVKYEVTMKEVEDIWWTVCCFDSSNTDLKLAKLTR